MPTFSRLVSWVAGPALLNRRRDACLSRGKVGIIPLATLVDQSGSGPSVQQTRISAYSLLHTDSLASMREPPCDARAGENAFAS